MVDFAITVEINRSIRWPRYSLWIGPIQVPTSLGTKAFAFVQDPFVKGRHILLQVSEIFGSISLGNASELIVIIHHAEVLWFTFFAFLIGITAVLQAEVVSQLVNKSTHANIAHITFIVIPVCLPHSHHEITTSQLSQS